MKIDRRIALALGLAAQDAGSNAALARAIGVTDSTVARWRSGIISEIAEDMWERVFPHISKYLPDDQRYLPRSRLRGARSGHAADVAYNVPVYGLANAVVMEPETVYGDIAPDNVEILDRIPVADPAIIAAFRVTGQSMEPEIRDGDIVLCERPPGPEELPNGVFVVAKADDIAVCKRWRRYGKVVILESVNPSGDNIEIDASEIHWVLRVRQILREV